MKFVAGKKLENPLETTFPGPFHSPRKQHGVTERQLGIPAVGGGRLSVCATESPVLL